MILRLLAATSLLCAAGVALAAGAQARDGDTDAPPPIEIVRGGGVAEVYRREGADFAAYGPEGKAIKPTAESQAVQALVNAHDVQFVSLDAPMGGVVAVPCPASDCVGGIAVIGRAAVQSTEQKALASVILRGWLLEPGGHWSACLPEYHHALTFSAEGHAWEVLLSYGCGQYLIRRDGVETVAADASEWPGHSEFNQQLDTAGIRHWDAEARTWRTPAVH